MLKKILLITDYFGPNPGGIENFITGFAKYAKSIRNDITLVCFDIIHYFSENEVMEFNSYFTDLYRFKLTQNKFIPFLDFFKNITSEEFFIFMEHFEKNFQIQHILFGNIPFFHKHLIHYIKKKQIQHSIILHPYDIEKIEFYHKNLINFINQSKYIFVYTNYFYELALSKGILQEKVIKIPVGIHYQWELSKKNISSRIKELVKKQKNKVKILTVGPLTKKRNFERIFFVFEKLKYFTDISKIHWFIVGSGMETPFLKEYIQIHNLEDYFTLTGFIHQNEVGYLYYNSEIYFHPGGNEKDPFSGFSTTLLEASYTALPIVSGLGAGIEEIIQNNVSGFIHREDDYEGMAYHLKELITDSRLSKKMGSYGEQKANIEFSIERCSQQILNRIS